MLTITHDIVNAYTDGGCVVFQILVVLLRSLQYSDMKAWHVQSLHVAHCDKKQVWLVRGSHFRAVRWDSVGVYVYVQGAP